MIKQRLNMPRLFRDGVSDKDEAPGVGVRGTTEREAYVQYNRLRARNMLRHTRLK